MLDHIEIPDLSSFSQPAWNDSQAIPTAFAAVLSANDLETSESAYHCLLYAIGNDHAGTYHSVALGLLPVLERVLRVGGPWSQHAVLDVLTDLFAAFKPEPGQELYSGASLEELIRWMIIELAPVLSGVERVGGVASRGAKELLDLIRDALAEQPLKPEE